MAHIGLGDPDTKDARTREERGGCSDCPQWGKCLFHMARYGGFKGQPDSRRYVRYRLITDAAENSNAKEDFCACDVFVETLQDRMLTGQQLRAEGRDGEFVSVIVDGGDTVTQGFEVGFNTRNQIVNPQPNLVEDMRASGYEVNLEDRTGAARYEQITITRHVPKFKAPAKGTTSYSREIQGRELARQRDELDAEEKIWAERRKAAPPTEDDWSDEAETPKRKRRSLLSDLKDEARE